MKMPVSCMREGDFNARIRKALNDLGFIGVRIENAITSGAPDWWVNCCQEGKTFWIEAKIFKHRRVLLRPSQSAWHRVHGKFVPIFIFALDNTDRFVQFWQAPIETTPVPGGLCIDPPPLLSCHLNNLGSGIVTLMTMRMPGIF